MKQNSTYYRYYFYAMNILYKCLNLWYNVSREICLCKGVIYMIKVKKEPALHIITMGKDNGSTIGYVNNDNTTLYNAYVRVLDNFKFIIVENEITDEFYALQDTDTFKVQPKLDKALDEGVKVLSEVVELLKQAKESE